MLYDLFLIPMDRLLYIFICYKEAREQIQTQVLDSPCPFTLEESSAFLYLGFLTSGFFILVSILVYFIRDV